VAKQKSETHAKAWPASAIEMRKVDELVPYARNARTHSPEQVSQIAASIREWGWTTPVLVAEDDTILAGHGRLMAARQLGIAEVPTMVARGWSEAQRRAYVLADNQLALNSGWDSDLLRVELEGLKELDFDLDVIGFDADDMQKFGLAPVEAFDATDESGLLDQKFQVLIECVDEQEQVDVISTAEEKGWKCRAFS
jgi:hypothetical protein